MHPGNDQDGTGPGRDAAGLRFDGVDLVGVTAHGPSTVEGLSLSVDSVGITVLGPLPGAARLIPWSGVSAATVGPPVTAGGGRVATPLDISSVGRTVRFHLFADRVHASAVAVLGAQLAGWAAPRPPVTTWSSSVVPAPGPASAPLASVPVPSPVAAHASTPLFAPLPLPVQVRPMGEGQVPVVHPFGWGPTPKGRGGRPGHRRRRRVGVLVLALLLIATGTGLAATLASHAGHTTTTTTSPLPVAPAPDQKLADRVMLTQADLPTGWQASGGSGGGSGGGAGQANQTAQAQIEQSFTTCMGITVAQGSILLGGAAPDRTAQTVSPVFVDAGAATGSGGTLELQTSASVVRTHLDEQQDLALFTAPSFPSCSATATAAELQLGVNETTGGNSAPGPATSTVVPLVAPAGELVVGVTMSFAIVDGSSTIPVEVDQLVVGTDRIEGQLVAFAIGAPFPSDVLAASVGTFEHRLLPQPGVTAA